jgi:hypothetical protein
MAALGPELVAMVVKEYALNATLGEVVELADVWSGFAGHVERIFLSRVLAEPLGRPAMIGKKSEWVTSLLAHHVQRMRYGAATGLGGKWTCDSANVVCRVC